MDDEENILDRVAPPAGGGASDFPTPPSRSEAVRRALAAGHEAAKDGTEYILKEFGIAISPSLFLAAKATERRKGWAKEGKPGRKPRQSAGSGEVLKSLDELGGDDDDPIG